MAKRLTAFCVVLLMAACSIVSLPGKDAEIPKSELAPAETARLTHEVMLIADNQLHDLFGRGAPWVRTAAADTVVSVAIRSPQLDLFGSELVGEVLRAEEPAEGQRLWLHLGDACNIGSTSEFEEFVWVMRGAHGGWLLAPGNHDAFFFGNEHHSDIEEWDAASTGKALTKDRLVAYYLAALVLQPHAWARQLAESLGPEVMVLAAKKPGDREACVDRLRRLERAIHARGDGSFRARGEFDGPYLRKAAWHIDTEDKWRSYVVQEADVTWPGAPATSILLLDTATYASRPALVKILFGKVAGVKGEVSDPQWETVDRWTVELRNWIVAGHHPYEELASGTRKRLDKLLTQGLPVYCSAHTHLGAIHPREGSVEINVGSLLDPPMEYRDLTLHHTGGRAYVASRRYLIEDVLRERDLVLPPHDHMAREGDPDDYLAYAHWLSRRGISKYWDSLNALTAETVVKVTVLAAYGRLLRDVPTKSAEGIPWPKAPDGRTLDSDTAIRSEIAEIVAWMKSTDYALTTDKRGASPEFDRLIEFLLQLRDFDAARPVDAELRRRYRLSQALWASNADGGHSGVYSRLARTTRHEKVGWAFPLTR